MTFALQWWVEPFFMGPPSFLGVFPQSGRPFFRAEVSGAYRHGYCEIKHLIMLHITFKQAELIPHTELARAESLTFDYVNGLEEVFHDTDIPNLGANWSYLQIPS